MPELSRIHAAIGAEPWLIEPAALEQIIAIAERANEAPEAVSTRLGRPLDNARKVQIHGDVAQIPITGPIFRYANLFTEISGATSLQVLATDFQSALDAPGVKRIVLDINSPGGQSAGIAEFARLVRASTKPITAYVGDQAASAAYWIAAAASNIVMSPTAMVGSIGVVLSWRPDATKPVEIVSSQSPLKRADPSTEAGRAEAQRIVDQLAAVFVADVAAFRGVSQETVLSDFGRGSLLVGEHAVAAGMADHIASLTSLLSAGAPGSTQRRGITMAETKTEGAPTIDRAYLNTHHANLVSEIRTEGHAEGLAAGLATGRTEGATAERERIQAVRAQSIPGHEALIEQLAFDGQTTGPEAAVAVLAAERQKLTAAQATITGAPGPVPAAPKPETASSGGQVVRLDASAIYRDRRAGTHASTAR